MNKKGNYSAGTVLAKGKIVHIYRPMGGKNKVGQNMRCHCFTKLLKLQNK